MNNVDEFFDANDYDFKLARQWAYERNDIDDGEVAEGIEYLVNKYRGKQKEYEIVNDVLMSMCGYDLDGLAKRVLEREPLPEKKRYVVEVDIKGKYRDEIEAISEDKAKEEVKDYLEEGLEYVGGIYKYEYSVKEKK